jgi:hypothetical protein
MEMFAHMNVFAALCITSGLIGTFLLAYAVTREELSDPIDAFIRWIMILWCSIFVGPFVFILGIAFVWFEFFDGRKPSATMPVLA